ncbi:hypothetical protein ACFLRM_04885 [Acidobacteriota bacterium]
MKRLRFLLCFMFLALLFLSCGKKGPILPPFVNTPQKVDVFKAFQRGDKIVLQWSLPATYIDGNPLPEVSEVEIWNLSIPRESLETETFVSEVEFEKQASLITTISKVAFPEFQTQKDKIPIELNYYFPLAGEALTSKIFSFGIKIKDRKNKKSKFSEIHSVTPEVVPLPPQDLRATLFKDRVALVWNSPEVNIDKSSPSNTKGYNIYRKEGDGIAQRLSSELNEENEYQDESFLFGKTYGYFVRASATDSSPYLESENSEIVDIVTEDIFAPVSPSGLLTIAGEMVIALSWNSNQEEDLAGYKVWRRLEGEEEFVLLTPELTRENTYNDTEVDKNIKYYYAITALDMSGNESQKSEIVSEIIKEGTS